LGRDWEGKLSWAVERRAVKHQTVQLSRNDMDVRNLDCGRDTKASKELENMVIAENDT
jgi:hypothetical protein